MLLWALIFTQLFLFPQSSRLQKYNQLSNKAHLQFYQVFWIYNIFKGQKKKKKIQTFIKQEESGNKGDSNETKEKLLGVKQNQAVSLAVK